MDGYIRVSCYFLVEVSLGVLENEMPSTKKRFIVMLAFSNFMQFERGNLRASQNPSGTPECFNSRDTAPPAGLKQASAIFGAMHFHLGGLETG